MIDLVAKNIFNVEYQRSKPQAGEGAGKEDLPLKGKAVLHLPKEWNAGAEEVEQLVSKIFAHLGENTLEAGPNLLHTIALEKAEGNEISYRFDGKSYQIGQEGAKEEDPLFKILSVVQEEMASPIERTAVQRRGFQEYLAHLWDLFVSALFYLFGRYTEKDLEHLNSFTARYDQDGPERFERVLSTFRKTAASKKLGKFNPLLEQLSQAEESSVNMRQAIKCGPEAIAAFSKESALRVAEKFKQQSGSPGRTNLETFAFGYFRGNTYHPLLVTFFAEEGALKLRIVNQDPALLELQESKNPSLKKINPIQEFQFDSQSPSALEQGIEGMFNVLLPFQVKGQSEEEVEIKKEGLHLLSLVQNIMDRKVLGAGGGAKGKKGSEEFQAPLLPEIVQDIVSNFGCKVSKIPKILEPYTSKKKGDFWKLCFSASQALFPGLELGKKEKIEWEMSFFHNHLDQFIQHTSGWQALNFEEKKIHLLALEKTLAKIEKSYEGLYRDHAAFQKIWQPDGASQSELAKLKEAIAELKASLANQKLMGLNHASSISPSWAAEFRLGNEIGKAAGKIQAMAATPSLSVAQASKTSAMVNILEEVAKEKSVDASKNRAEFIGTLDSIVKDVELAFADKRWNEICDFVPALLEKLPPPSAQSADRFGSKVWDGLTEDQIDHLSKTLTLLAHHFWEGHLRKELMSLDHAEAFAIANVRAIQIKLLREKSDLIKKRGAVSADDKILTAFDEFTCDKDAILHLIHKNPFHRSGFDARMEERRLALETFFTEGAGKGKPIALDTERVKYKYTTTGLQDAKFIGKVQQIAGYQSDVFASCLQREERNPQKDVLPELLIDFRRLTVFGQYLMHPESTLHQAFDQTGALGDIERQKWLLEQFGKVASDEMSDDDASKGLFAEEWKIRMATIRAMGSPIKLKIHHTAAEEQGDKCVAAYSGSYKLEFEPTGVLFNDNRNAHHDEISIGKLGKVPKSYLETVIGKKDKEFEKEKFLNKQRPRDQEVKRSLTEVTTWLLEEYDPSIPELDTVLNSKLRGLEIEDMEISGKASVNTIYNCFDVLFNRPDVLNNPKVVQILELALYRTGALQNLMQKNPFYFDKGEIGSKLTHQIEQAGKREHHVALGFLLQFAGSLREQAAIAREIADTPGHPLVQHEKQAFLEEKRLVLDKIGKELPHLEMGYNIGDKAKPQFKTGWALLQELSNNASFEPSVRKHLYTTLLNSYRRIANVHTKAFGKLSHLDCAHIVQAYYFIKYSGEDAGSLPLQRDIKRWFEGEFLPYLTGPAMKDPMDARKILTAHWILTETGKAEIPAELPQWEKKDPFTYEVQGKRIETSLLTGSIAIEGIQQGFETVIPEAVLKKEEYRILFGTKPQKARVFPLTSSGDVLEFRIKEGGSEYRIRQNVLEDTVAILQKIDYKGVQREYLFQKAEGGKEMAKGSAKLVERFGIWQSVEEPGFGLCIFNPNGAGFDDKEVIEVYLKGLENQTVRVTQSLTPDGRIVLQDKEHEVSAILGFSDYADTLFIKKPGFSKELEEVRFLSKGLSIVKSNDGSWKTKGLYKDFELCRDVLDCIGFFGKDFHQFLLPVEKKNRVSGITEKKFLIWPGELKVNSKGNKEDLLHSGVLAETETTKEKSVPVLSVSLKLGELGDEEGRLSGSSASFLYLAYAALLQGNYEAGLKFLEQAEASPFNPQEKEIFETIAARISQFDDTSKKGLSLRMKAEIAAAKIRRVQLGEKGFDPNNWKKHLDKVRHQMSLYESYKEKIQEDAVAKTPKKGADQAFLLTGEERLSFETAQAEAIEFLVVTLSNQEDPLQALLAAKEDPHAKLVQEDLRSFIKTVIYRLEKKTIQDPIGKIASAYIGKEEFLSHFGAYWDQIANDGLDSSHWKIQKLKSLIFQNASADELKALEAGKKMLIELAMKKGKQPIPDEFYRMTKRMRELGSSKPNFLTLFLKALFRFLAQQFYFVRNLLEFFEIDVNDQKYSEKNVVEAAISFAPCNFPEKIEKKTPEGKTENIEFATTIDQVKLELKNQSSLFSSEEKLLWEIGIDLMKKEVKTDQEQIDLVKVIAGGLKYKIHVLAMRHAAEEMKKAALLEKEKDLPKAISSPVAIQLDAEHDALNVKASWLDPLVAKVFTPVKWKPSHSALEKFIEDLKCDPKLEERFAKKFEEIRQGDASFAKKAMAQAEAGNFESRAFSWYLFSAAKIKESGLKLAPFDAIKSFGELDSQVNHAIVLEKEQQILALSKHVESKFATSPGSELEAMEEEENQLRIKGVKLAAEKRIEELKNSPGIIRSESLKFLRSSIQEKISAGQKRCKEHRAAILKAAKENRKAVPEIDSMFRKSWIYSESDIFDKVLDFFQEQKFQGSAFQALEKEVLKFLIAATEVQQLQIAAQKLGELKALKKQEMGLGSSDAVKREQLAVEWEMTSKLLHNHLLAGASSGRYLDKTGNLNKPDLARKFLVTEFRLGIVLRNDQIQTVEAMLDSPNKAVLRPPGFGKSKAVIPPLLAILAERGRFPVVLETEELCRIAETDLDKTNRMIFNQARHKFRFHSSHSIEPSELVDEYNRLLRAKADKGYIVTSIESLAALDNILVRLGKELKEKFIKLQESSKTGSFDEITDDNDLLTTVMDLKTTQEKRHWLMKIREAIHSGQFVADEVDDIFDINRWVNEAIDDHEPPSRKLTRGTGYIFETIFESLEKKSELSQLAKALLCNSQANFNRSQIDHYKKLIAGEIYEKETPFDLKKEEWQSVKEKVGKQEFVDFVTGKPGVKISLKWDETQDTTPLEYIGILKHQMTKGLPTVFGEEIDLDYGLSEDGCTIEPLKKGEKLPNTRHGNPYELVGYHFAYYASRVSDKEFFAREWQKIQSQITQGIAPKDWSDWYKEAGVSALPPREQVEALFKHLQKPQSWKQRHMLLSDAAMSHVRLFPYQIKCNVQDPLVDEDISLGGASGTVNFYALPGSFEKDESVDSREVSGNLDLSLAEMSPKGLDQEIGIFNGSGSLNGREKIKELAFDLGCKSIINQGGALEGKNSLKVVKFIRKALAKAKIERQILFVDPASRHQMIWDPEESKPVPFDPAKLRPNFLAYFGPPDTRGTDFPIELGYSGFIVGKTMDEEQRQQAILRLRKFGKGQTIRVFMHQSIQHSLNVKLARAEDHPVSLSEVMNDVKRRSLDKKSESNWKSAVRKTQTAIIREVKAAWFKPSIEDLDAHWRVRLDKPGQKREDLERILTSIASDVALYEVFEKTFISKRELDFKKDFEPVEHVAATKEIESHYDQNLKKAADLAKAFESVSSGMRIVDLLNSFTKGEPIDYQSLAGEYFKANVSKFSKEEVKALIQWAAPGQFAALSPQIDLLWMLQQDPEERAKIILAQAAPLFANLSEEQVKELVNKEKMFAKEGLIDAGTAERLGSIQKRLDALQQKILDEKKAFIAEEEATKLHSKHLKKLVPKSHDADSNSQEQVQQQQQQQQMQSLQTAKKKKEAEEIKVKYVWHDWVSSYPGVPQEKSMTAIMQLTQDQPNPALKGAFPSINAGAALLLGGGDDFGFDSNLKVSINQLKLLQARKLLEGETMDRIAVCKKSNGDNSLQFYAIDMQDQNRGFSPGIARVREKIAEMPCHVEVHSVRSDLSDKTFGPTDYLEGFGPSIVKSQEAAFLRGLVQMKLFMGAIHYTEAEAQSLNLWLKGLNKAQIGNLTKLICKIHDVDRVSQIRGWEKSSLSGSVIV